MYPKISGAISSNARLPRNTSQRNLYLSHCVTEVWANDRTRIWLKQVEKFVGNNWLVRPCTCPLHAYWLRGQMAVPQFSRGVEGNRLQLITCNTERTFEQFGSTGALYIAFPRKHNTYINIMNIIIEQFCELQKNSYIYYYNNTEIQYWYIICYRNWCHGTGFTDIMLTYYWEGDSLFGSNIITMLVGFLTSSHLTVLTLNPKQWHSFGRPIQFYLISNVLPLWQKWGCFSLFVLLFMAVPSGDWTVMNSNHLTSHLTRSSGGSGICHVTATLL